MICKKNKVNWKVGIAEETTIKDSMNVCDLSSDQLTRSQLTKQVSEKNTKFNIILYFSISFGDSDVTFGK